MLQKIILFLLLVVPFSSFAYHLRSGEITYVPDPKGKPNTYLITFTVYSNATPGTQYDLNDLDVNFGDGFTANLTRENGPAGYNKFPQNIYCLHLGELVTPTTRKNVFTATHTYTSNKNYIIYLQPSSRNSGLINIASSDYYALYVESMLKVSNGLPPFSSPVLSLPPVADGCVNQVYKINPGAIDPDGDELRFQLVKCKKEYGTDIPGFKYPNELDPSGNTTFTMDPRSGEITWTKPTIQGEYNIAFRIEKYRNNVLIGYVLRDMQITIAPCSNNPPKIDPLPDICVEAGKPITYLVNASDPDKDTLTFTTTGMPYDVTFSPATYTSDGTFKGSTSGTFTWNTNAVHFRKNPYQVYYKVTDSHLGSNLTDVVSNFITLVAPSVKNVTTKVYQRGFRVSWDKTVFTQATGYNIYRKKAPPIIPFDSCTLGVPVNTGFTRIATVNDLNTLSFIDLNNGNGFTPGYTYCYVVTALFDAGVESLPSESACSLIKYPFINLLQDTLIGCQWSTLTIDSTIIKYINADQQTKYSWSASGQLQIGHADQPETNVKLNSPNLQTIKLMATSGVSIDSALIYIRVYPLPDPLIQLKDLGGMPDSVMFYNRSTNSVRTEWLFPNGTRSSNNDSVLYVFPDNGTFRIHLSVYNTLGCPDTTSIAHTVLMRGLSLPNAFEPENPDALLNRFRPVAIGLQTYYLGIWDLWGNLIWYSDKVVNTRPDKGWDGTDSQGRKLPAQNYIWRMKATFIDGSVWKGVKDRFGKFHSEGTLYLLR